MKENEVTARCRIVAGRMRTVLFRNSRGRYYDERSDRWIPYGVGPNGAGDYLGWKMVVITPDMVGKQFAQFVSAEFKRSKGGRTGDDQSKWRDAVNAAGGRAGVIASESDMTALLKD